MLVNRRLRDQERRLRYDLAFAIGHKILHNGDGLLRAVYRGNGIPLPWGNMSAVSDPCPRWAVFQMLRQPPGRAAVGSKGASQQPRSQISVMQDSKRARLYCCHSLLTRDAADVNHVLSVGVDLLPALAAQAIRTVAQVLNIEWIADALAHTASVICPRSTACPRDRHCSSALSAASESKGSRQVMPRHR